MQASTPTKRDQIVEELRALILSGDLPRGSRLPQDELAKRFSSSITPVREALRALEAESLVISEPHRGVRVAGVDFERVKATYIVRRLTESYAMRRAAIRLSPHELRRAERLLEDLNEAARLKDPDLVRDLNKKFHFFFYERCGIPTLLEEIDTLWRAFPWDLLLAHPEPAGASEAEHRAILEAVRAGDAEQAASALESHLARSFSDLTARFTGGRSADPFDINND
ncbi:GntR family transcriptional regulator [Pseudarthrobacter oxydans]|uniref:GntR family transcriptional regulator n=1 Tax=Pseudarthrobacter oxydans TaxID=1671 RepID=UPI002AA8F22D|nr:GntR family transcriptional regulator [Pseudarthrobacter oxydans]WPU11155.1 GntR family transcriptional regulator [Pseudarthrobacter oxydans]